MGFFDHITLMRENERPGPGPFNAVARLLKFADTDSNLISIGTNRKGGLRLSVSPSVSSGGEGGYAGPFAVSFTQGGKIKVNPGYISVNGELGDCHGATLSIPPGEKFICVHLAMAANASSNTSAEGPEIRFATPSSTDYPIAMYENGNLVSLRVPVASFIFAYPGGSV